jgi:hypothetical protein
MERWLIPNVDHDEDGKVTFDEILVTVFAVLVHDEETFKVFFDTNVTDEQYGKVCKLHSKQYYRVEIGLLTFILGGVLRPTRQIELPHDFLSSLGKKRKKIKETAFAK